MLHRMNRLVWLLLLVCTAAFARVQPVELPVEPEACCCCDSANACTMPDCAPPPATSMVALDRPIAAQHVLQKRAAQRSAHLSVLPFYAPLLTATLPNPIPFAREVLATTTATPIRVRQCQWLI